MVELVVAVLGEVLFARHMYIIILSVSQRNVYRVDELGSGGRLGFGIGGSDHENTTWGNGRPKSRVDDLVMRLL